MRLDAGSDPLDDTTLFEIGSLTKTMTGLLLAHAVVTGELGLGVTVGEILGGDSGGCAAVTVASLATHRSGLPRLPPNHDDRRVNLDPYARYGVEELLAALAAVEVPVPGTYAYSNFGFMLLGYLLERASGKSFSALLRERCFLPLGMLDSCLSDEVRERQFMPAYIGVRQVPWWTLPLPGAGGVASSIRDMAAYVLAHVEPASTPSDATLKVAMEVHADSGDQVSGLAWRHYRGGLMHGGATGGSRAFVAIHSRSKTGIVLLANGEQASMLESTGLSVLTEIVRSRL